MRETIPDALDGERVDRVISMLTGVSRSEAADVIASGSVRLDEKVVAKSSQRVRVDQTLDVPDHALEFDHSAQPDPSVEVELLHVDDHVIVVNKAPGDVVHPGAGNTTGTIIQGLLAQFPEISSVGDEDRPGVVHRLDKGTSGVFVVARTLLAYESLGLQLRERSMHRRYLTLGWGHPRTDRGVIDAPIGRAVRDPTRMVVREDGKIARTHYEVDARWDDPQLSLFTCRLETGRTHQIRVHLEAIGHPVVGDRRYGGGRDFLSLERPALHARELGFVHPATEQFVEFVSPVPADLVALFADLGAPASGSVELA